MSSATQRAATLDDLYRVDGKAELIAGRIVPLMATGYRPSRVASRIFRSLDDYAQATGRGEAFADNTGFAVAPLSSGRESFSPDASYFLGPFPSNEMRFLNGPPSSRSKSGARMTMAIRLRQPERPSVRTILRLVLRLVWDVDPINDRILKYTYVNPTIRQCSCGGR